MPCFAARMVHPAPPSRRVYRYPIIKRSVLLILLETRIWPKYDTRVIGMVEEPREVDIRKWLFRGANRSRSRPNLYPATAIWTGHLEPRQWTMIISLLGYLSPQVSYMIIHVFSLFQCSRSWNIEWLQTKWRRRFSTHFDICLSRGRSSSKLRANAESVFSISFTSVSSTLQKRKNSRDQDDHPIRPLNNFKISNVCLKTWARVLW